MASSNEISSKGYGSYIDFYRYIQKLQHDFGLFWLNKRYHSNTEKVESFIKGDENLDKAQNSLPKNFWGGILLTLVYILFFLIFSLFRFKSFLRDDNNN